MAKEKSETPYRTVSLPNEIYEVISEYTKQNPTYASVASFVRVAILEKLDRDHKIKYRIKDFVKSPNKSPNNDKLDEIIRLLKEKEKVKKNG